MSPLRISGFDRTFLSRMSGRNLFSRRVGREISEQAFTLIEMLTATAILVLMLVILFSIIGHVTGILRLSTAKVETFQSARTAFDLMVRNLSQSTLNTYLDYAYDNGTSSSPTRYKRASDLSFVVGPAGSLAGTADTGQAVFFQGPLNYIADTANLGGLEALLNACGYYVSFSNNKSAPSHVAGKADTYRYRLMQLLVPSEVKNAAYPDPANGNAWFKDPALQDKYAVAVADNIIAVIIRPQDPAVLPPSPTDIGGHYTYDSTAGAELNPQETTANQLPPALQVTMVAIDEASARRLDSGSTAPSVITSALANKFTDTTRYQKDIEDMEGVLNENHIQYRIFSSSVPLRESKWTK
jgi:uncharacterized protein (TIGR02599 family)